ncbi:hypothetical protein O3G_MSEX005070 [Manduca sexta]|uniref:Transient receptor ion channel domain-containing protein n=2 Tax=Manduca sexta TaxID=7130 RepID=A0A921YX61_MANSE|nr:hypothetical protein O3G_MSEX005070 [Manduca sexta]
MEHREKNKSSRSNVTDSIENYSLPNSPIQEQEYINNTSLISAKSERKSMKIEENSNFVEEACSCCKESTTSTSNILEHKLHNVVENRADRFAKSTGCLLHYLKKEQCELTRPSQGKTMRFDSKTYFVKHRKSDDKVTEDYANKNIKHQRVYLPKLQPSEAEYIRLVSENSVAAVKKYIEDHPELNINCTNFQGVSALHVSVQKRFEDMVEFLLKFTNIEIGDTALQAVRDNSIKILEMLLNALKNVSPGLEFGGAAHSTEFPLHVTPIILAAQLGRYEIIGMLLARGHTILRPHFPKCPCVACKNSFVTEDPLYTSSARLSVYRAISSPAYLVHTSCDPVLSAFLLAIELTDNAAASRHLASAYMKLRDNVRIFAVDLIGCCRTSEEVELMLKQTSGCGGRRHFVLPRLLMAVNYKQKEFVAHPNTQQVLESYWLGNWYSWKRKSSYSKACVILSRVFLIPFILVMCMVAPRHRLVKHWQIPLNKLITHATAYFVFLALVFYVSNQDKSGQKRGPPSTGAEGPLILFVCGYTWSAIRMCYIQGSRRYFTVIWHWAEAIMLILFGLTFAFWIISAVDIAENDEEDLDRKYWNQYDPTLLAEGTFCLATIFAYFRLMFLCQLNYHLGPLQVSLGKMTIDIYKYIIVFAIIISAFAAGLSRFYQYYEGMVYEDEFGMKTMQVSSFTSLTDTLNTLFWALFCMAPLESADVVIENTRDETSTLKYRENRHGYTERIGYFCFGCFEVISVIVVLNMLIATMSNTFQRVTDNAAIEWTFGRTEMYLDYMSQTTLPSPFNMIPTASGMANITDWFKNKCCKRNTVCICNKHFNHEKNILCSHTIT